MDTLEQAASKGICSGSGHKKLSLLQILTTLLKKQVGAQPGLRPGSSTVLPAEPCLYTLDSCTLTKQGEQPLAIPCHPDRALGHPTHSQRELETKQDKPCEACGEQLSPSGSWPWC